MDGVVPETGAGLAFSRAFPVLRVPGILQNRSPRKFVRRDPSSGPNSGLL